MQNRKLERKKLVEELTRKDILDSAVSVLLENKMNGFTMDRVASHAGFVKGTLYLYFKSKQELLDSVLDECFKPLEKEYERIISAESDPISKLEQCAIASLKHVEENKPLLHELRSVLFNNMDKDISDKASWYWITINLFATALDEAIKVGKLRPMNTEKIATLFLGSINSLTSHRILSSVTEAIEEDVRELMDLYIKGLAV